MKEKVSTNEAQPVDNSAKEKKKNKTRKAIATTTYFIAMLCLLAGLFVPLFYCVDGVELTERMMLRYLPSMFNGIAGKEIIQLPEGSWFKTYYGYTPGKFDFMSLIGVLYAVVTVISVIMLIPVLLGSKKKNTSARCALGVEVLAMLVTLVYIAYTTYFLVNSGTLGWTDYNFLIAFGGVLLMAIIQTISSKGSIGVSKVIGLLLSVIGVIALLDLTLFIPQLADPLSNLSVKLNAGDKATFIANGESSMLGIYGINFLILIKDMIPQMAEMAQGGKDGILSLVVVILLILIALFTVLNLIFDVIGLSTGKKYKKDRSPCKNGGSNTFALVRYILALIFVIALVVITFFIDGTSTGLYLWLLLIVLVISLVNAAVRTAVDNARYKKGAVAPAEEVQQRPVFNDPAFAAQTEEPELGRLPVAEETPANAEEATFAEEVSTPEPLPVYVEPDYMPEATEPEAKPEPLPVYVEPTPVAEPLSAPLEESEEPTRTVYIYGGATDEFMDTLTDNEKVEFVELFIKKSKGTVNGVPDYSIDGDNSDFFPAVFVHINRYRNIVSDALMTKMYKQLGKTM